MNDKEDFETSSTRLWEGLPAPLPPWRLKELYGPAMEETRLLIRKAFAPSRAEVVVSLLRQAGRMAMRIASHAADVATDLLTPSPSPQPAFATRALGGSRPPAFSSRSGAADRLVVEKPGEGGHRLHLELETGANNSLDVRVCLLDASGARVAPLELSISDSESGDILLKPTRYASGEVVLHGVEPGLYGISAIAGDVVSTLSLLIGEEAGSN